MGKLLLRIDEACRLLGDISASTYHRWAAQGKVPRPQEKGRVNRAELEAMIEKSGLLKKDSHGGPSSPIAAQPRPGESSSA